MKKLILIILALMSTGLMSDTITFDINDYTFSDDSLTVSYKEKTYRDYKFFGMTFPIVFREVRFDGQYAQGIEINSSNYQLIKPDIGLNVQTDRRNPYNPIYIGARGIKRHVGFSVMELNPFFVRNDSLFFVSSVDYELTNYRTYDPPVEFKKGDYSKIDVAIITSEEFSAVFETYRDFKIKQGFTTVIKKVEEIYAEYPGETDVLKIRSYIKDKYLSNDLEYVIVGGGYKIVPVGSALPYASSENGNIYTDAIYSQLDGNPDNNMNGFYFEVEDKADYYPDVYVGRFPVNTLEEAVSVIDKTIGYYSSSRNYRPGFNTSALFAGFKVKNDNDGKIWCDNAKEEFPQTFTLDTLYEGISPDFGKDALMSALGSGYNFFYSQSHGDYHTIRQLNNNFKIWSDDMLSLNGVSGLYYIGACKPGTYSEDSFSRKAMINPNGGCVNYIGSSDWEYPDISHNFSAYFFKELLSGRSYGKSLAEARIVFSDLDSLGNANMGKSKYMAHTYSQQGDPSNKPFLREPNTINISSIGSFKRGKSTVNGTFSTTPNDTVFITLSTGTEILAKTKVTGSTFSLSYDNLVSDSVTVSYHSQECFLRTYKYSTISSNGIEFEVSSIEPYDPDGSGIIEHGQSFGLSLLLKITSNPNFVDSLAVKLKNITHSGISSVSDTHKFRVPKTGNETKLDMFNLSFFSADSVVSDSVAVIDIEISRLSGTVLFTEKIFVPVSVPYLKLESYKRSGSTFKPRIINPTKGRIDEAVISLYEAKNTVSVVNLSGYSDIYDSLEFQIDSTKTYRMSFQINGDNIYYSDYISFIYGGSGNLKLYGDHSIGKINLEWECTYPDVKGYNVYTSSDQNFSSVQKRNFELRHSKSFSFGNTGYEAIYAKVAPVDQNGYEFMLSESVLIEPFGLYKTGTFKVADFESYNPVYFGGRLISSTLNSAVAGINSDGSLINFTGLIHDPEPAGFYGVSDMQGYAVGDVTGDGNDNMVNYLYQMGDSTLVKVINLQTGEIAASRNVYGFVMENAPVLADHDGDGALEILMSVFNGNIGGAPADGAYVYMLKYNNGNLDIASGYPLYSSANSYYVHSPSVVDMNNDGIRELIFDNGTKILVYNFETGVKITEYTMPRTVQTSLSFCDYNNDGNTEMFALTESYGTYGKLFGFSFNGSVLSELPVTSGGINVDMKTAVLNDLTPPVSFADIDNDGVTEIIVLTASKLYVFDSQFNNYPNFPVSLDPRITKNNTSPASLADFNGDGHLDILFTDANYRVWCYSGYSGELLSGFPVKINDLKRNELNSMAVADLDGDGTLEFAVGVNDGIIVVYDYPYQTSSRGIYDNYRGDLHNSGIFNYLTAPQNISVSFNGSDMTISWEAVTSASSYHIYSSVNPYSNFVYEGSTTGTVYTIYNVSEPRKFYYVKAVK